MLIKSAEFVSMPLASHYFGARNRILLVREGAVFIETSRTSLSDVFVSVAALGRRLSDHSPRLP